MSRTIVADTQEAPVEKAGANGSTPTPDIVASLDDILGLEDTQYETVYVPQWRRSVRLASLSGEARNRVMVALRKSRKGKVVDDEALLELQARVIVESMVDEAGEHIGDQSKAPALMGKNNAALVLLFTACSRLSGVGDEALAEAVDDLKGTPSGATGSD